MFRTPKRNGQIMMPMGAYANTHNLGMSSAAGFLQSAVGMLCILAANAVVRRLDPDSSLF